ncbi:hypothetical protein EYF80_016028 [Liparis tanakae]|uniref:Uncharacterized protein n=1 Tax=Liparis tanakae TaxID=230148 RepID=A0A4Z2I7K0_9TELE|nr:hypothetical protein EYF80_016028 [Liparis tanakae]
MWAEREGAALGDMQEARHAAPTMLMCESVILISCHGLVTCVDGAVKARDWFQVAHAAEQPTNTRVFGGLRCRLSQRGQLEGRGSPSPVLQPVIGSKPPDHRRHVALPLVSYEEDEVESSERRKRGYESFSISPYIRLWARSKQERVTFCRLSFVWSLVYESRFTCRGKQEHTYVGVAGHGSSKRRTSSSLSSPVNLISPTVLPMDVSLAASSAGTERLTQKEERDSILTPLFHHAVLHVPRGVAERELTQGRGNGAQ